MLLVLLLCFQDADALLGKPEEILLKAKTVSVTVKGEWTSTAGDLALRASNEGRWQLKGPGRFRFDGYVARAENKVVLACDGTKVRELCAGKTRELPLPPDPVQRLVRILARLSPRAVAVLAIPNVDRDKESGIPDMRALVAWSAAKEEGREKVGEREARKISATATWRKQGEEADSTAEVVTWLDAETGLPLRRTIRHVAGVHKVDIQETFSDWKLDGELADGVFEKP